MSMATDLHDKTEAMVVDEGAPPATVSLDTPHSPSLRPPRSLLLAPSATGTSTMSAGPQLPPLSATTRGTPPVFASPPPLYGWQPSIASWTGNAVSASQPQLSNGHTARQLKRLGEELARHNSFQSFYADATSTSARRQAAAQVPVLNFLKGSSDVAPDDIPSVKMLYEVAPSVKTLSINVPFALSFPEPRVVPAIKTLCIDEANSAVWTENRTATTLDVLHARHIPTLSVRNASLKTVHRCLAYLGDISVFVLIDDGDRRYLQLVDCHRHTHTYDGTFSSSTSFLLSKQTLAHVGSLTIGEWMEPRELSLLFGLACPPHLTELRVWFGALHSSLAARTEVLKYRDTGGGRIKALTTLVLTTKPPAGIAPRDAAPRSPLPRALVEGFLNHVHGRAIVIEQDVRLELCGISLDGYDPRHADAL
ncbi:hypothetical protein AURDEDRAFT_162728 [Auricularia subglabra TFB-10046 SS5]|nr:hypothetical protein AURDEDRAFT_162728 [Auricularia subglabra TFB-10046 SS5]